MKQPKEGCSIIPIEIDHETLHKLADQATELDTDVIKLASAIIMSAMSGKAEPSEIVVKGPPNIHGMIVTIEIECWRVCPDPMPELCLNCPEFVHARYGLVEVLEDNRPDGDEEVDVSGPDKSCPF